MQNGNSVLCRQSQQRRDGANCSSLPSAQNVTPNEQKSLVATNSKSNWLQTPWHWSFRLSRQTAADLHQSMLSGTL
jgi:hypothetical protein